MLVASNTSPISNLAIIGRLDLLRTQFREIWIPGAVEAELSQLADPAAQTAVRKCLKDGWIKPRVLRDHTVARLLEAALDQGEAEAIALALEYSADIVLLDERDGRRAAERAGLSVTGVLGVLLQARQSGHIEKVKPDIEALRSRANFFVPARLEESVLRAAGE